MTEVASLITMLAMVMPVQPPSRTDDHLDDLMVSMPSLEAKTSAPVSTGPSPVSEVLETVAPAEAPIPQWTGPETLEECIVDQGPLSRGRCFFEVNGGCYFSQPGVGPRTPTFDFAPINLRLGVSLNDPCFPGYLRGNFQGLLEFTTAPVVSGFGDIVVGPGALLRYSWVQPNSRFVPYFQGGAGFAYNNAFEDRSQRAIGQAIEFTLKAAVGCHYFLSDHCSLDAEAGYIHISNADLASRNLGINAVGGSVGFTLYLP